MQKGQQVYAIPEQNGKDYTSVWTKPGQTWKNCAERYNPETKKQDCRDSFGWLDKDAKVWIAGPKIHVATPDPFTDEMVMDEYYPVQFQYERNGKVHTRGKIGYVDASDLSDKPMETVYDPPKKEKKSCDLKSSKPNKSAITDVACMADIKNVDNAVSQIKDKVGFCAHIDDDQNKTANIYDNTILSKLKAEKVKPPMTKDNLIDIDAMARTLYGEMASCYRHGLHYPMAVARIIMNRAEQGKKFTKGKHDPKKPVTSQVATSPTQFSMWLRKLNGKNNPALARGMCPATSTQKENWRKQKGSPTEIAVWEQSVRIATEAVMFPASFKKRTENLENRYFYTSNLGKFFNMQQEKAVEVNGLPLSKGKCIEIWYEQKKDKPKS